MVKPNFNTVGKYSLLNIQMYERYLPSAFDESLSILQKINKVIFELNNIGEISNGLVDQWNELVKWILGEGLNEAVSEIILERIKDGTFDDLFESIVGLLSDLKTDCKSTVVCAINEVFTTGQTNKTDIEKIVNDLGNITNLTTNDKTNIVNAINELVIENAINKQAPTALGEATGRGVISGLKVRQQNVLAMAVEIGDNLTPNIVHLDSGARYMPQSVTLPINNSDPVLNRYDLIYVDSIGEIKVLEGNKSSTPTKPTLPIGGVELAYIKVFAGDTTVNDSDIEDVRQMKNLGSLLTTNKVNLVQAINEVIDMLKTLEESLGDIINNAIGNVSNLKTEDKTNLVNAINELVDKIGDLKTLKTISKNNIVSSINEIVDNIGDKNNLNTTQKDNIVNAINDVLKQLGNKELLETVNKTDLVSALNELLTSIGKLSDLDTIDKTNIVVAINELKFRLDNIGEVVNKSLNEIYNVVTTFGADPTGVKDSTTAIQNAIDDLKIKGGGVAFFPKGTYTVSTITVPQKVTLLGTGASSILKQLSTASNHVVISSNGATNITVKDIAIDGNRGERVGGTFGIHFLNNTDVIIENVVVYNCLGVGIDVRESWNVSILNCRPRKNRGHGININKCLFVTIDNVFSAENDIGIYIENGSRYCAITNNLLYKNVRSGFSIPIDSPSTEATIKNNIARENGFHGFEVQGSQSIVDSNIALSNGQVGSHQGILINCDNTVVSNNICYFNKGVGIDLGDCNSISVLGNHCIRNGLYGIECNSSNSVTINGNICSANSRDFPNVYSGIIVYADELFGGTSENVVVTGNRVTNLGTGNQAFGISVGENSNNVIAKDNDVTDGGATSNIGLFGTNYIVKDNIGFINSAILKQDFDVSAIGSVDIVIPVNMNVQLDPSKIMFSIISTRVNDFKLGVPMVVATTANTCTVRVPIEEASSTSGAKATINLQVLS